MRVSMRGDVISIVIPLYNEQDSLVLLFEKIATVLTKIKKEYEVVFVDDGSTDQSFSVCKNLHQKDPTHIKIIRFIRNFGKAAALNAGISKAKGDVIITMDADLQDDPEAIPEMLEKLSQGWDVVSGWKKVRYDPFLKTFPSKIWNRLTGFMSGVHLHDFNCGFKAYTQEAAKSIDIYGERHRYLPALAHWNGFKVTEMPVPHHRRQFGKAKYSGIGRFITSLFDLGTLLFLKRYLANPLHFFGILGLFFMGIGTMVLGYFGVEWIVNSQMRMRPLVFLSMGSVIMGIQFISIGLLGEMITNTQRRNIYQVREEVGNS